MENIKILSLPEPPNTVLNARVQDGVYTTESHKLDSLKIVVFISLSIVVVFFCYIDCKIKGMVFFAVGLVAFTVLWALIYREAIELAEKQNTKKVNGYDYKFWLHDTHDLIYELEVKVTSWQRSIRVGDCISFHKPQLKEYKGRVRGIIHAHWAGYYGKDITPLALIRSSNRGGDVMLKKAFVELIARYELIGFTGKPELMRYVGQREKELQYK